MTRESLAMRGSKEGASGCLIVLLWLAALGGGCGARRTDPVVSRGPTGSGGGGASAPSRASSTSTSPLDACAAEPTGLAALFHAGALIVFGEVHGTVETPAFVAEAACHAAQAGREVAVGMEIPRDLQPQLDRFLDSDGQPEDVATLIQGEHWNLQDGTASQALVGVIERVRLLRRAGRKVRMFFFDKAAADSGDRDQDMAANILAQTEHNTGVITLILTGNLHAKTDSVQWMSWHLARRHRDLVTLNVGYPGGSAYVCMMGGTCGIHTGLHGKDRGTTAFIDLSSPSDGYSGLFYLGAPVTASPPMKPQGPIKVLELPAQ